MLRMRKAYFEQYLEKQHVCDSVYQPGKVHPCSASLGERRRDSIGGSVCCRGEDDLAADRSDRKGDEQTTIQKNVIEFRPKEMRGCESTQGMSTVGAVASEVDPEMSTSGTCRRCDMKDSMDLGNEPEEEIRVCDECPRHDQRRATTACRGIGRSGCPNNVLMCAMCVYPGQN